MTELLGKAFENASKLTPQEQDALAKWLLTQMEDDRRWDASFGNSSSLLASLATEALREKDSGAAVPLVPDEL